jgi:hypothetical protein
VNKNDLRIDWATHEAARFACENWHYSKCIPVNKLVKIGVWENERFIGAVIFGYGTSPTIADGYGIKFEQMCELVRVALCKHTTPVSRILSIAMKFLKKKCPEMRLVVSFADQNAGHHGGIYQATNWVYSGQTAKSVGLEYDGKIINQMTLRHLKNGKKYNSDSLRKTVCKPKHRYLMPLDDAMRKQIESLAKPYPKRVTSADSGTLGNPAEKGRCDSDRNAFETQ